MSSKFVYVTYIRTTPEKLWDALTKPEFTRAYWFGVTHECDWKVGSPWKMMIPDGRVGDSGEVLEIEPLKRIVLKWRNEFRPELKLEGFTRCAFDIVQQGDMVQLKVTHESDLDNSKMIEGVSGGWPQILSSLKSLLETGKGLERTSEWPKG
ncbi:MAG: SRPBCC family protein [Rhizomicrobium sp.]